MRHRIGGGITGLGNPSAAMMMNNWPTVRRQNSLVRRCLQNAVDLFFTKHYKIGDFEDVEAWCDFGIDKYGLMIGQEPAYIWQYLKIVYICNVKELSYIENGVAFGYYGTSIGARRKYYKDYKRNCKFVRFIDRWHEILYKEAL
jgi:hypothetical protein